ncbi:hypothetical protein [Nocardioides alcanivorans]|uniref:hypothetical protein n=1 Tax=Nocardioides alcanivorans TaxID=2897352 RepID=UPI001F2042D3|nr:hypothetical protein [Nocardioides alcanivorans]
METETNAETTRGPAGAPVEQPTKEKLKDRVWGWRALTATAVAALVIGGAAGSGVTLLVNDDSGNRQRMGQFGPPGGGERPDFPDGERPDGRGGQGGQPGQPGSDGDADSDTSAESTIAWS